MFYMYYVKFAQIGSTCKCPTEDYVDKKTDERDLTWIEDAWKKKKKTLEPCSDQEFYGQYSKWLILS